jgi:hypothetical protein
LIAVSGDRSTLNVRKVKTIVVAKTSAPQATCATVMPTIIGSGCGSFGEIVLTQNAPKPNKS